MRRHLIATLAAGFVLGGAAPAAAQAPASAAAAPGWTCGATALRGTVLGRAIEPVVANIRPGASCAAERRSLLDTAPLPAPLRAGAISAATTLDGAGTAREQRVSAVGGVADLTVAALPTLPIAIPYEAVLAGVPTLRVSLPLLGDVVVDLRPAVQALLPGGALPDVELLRVAAVTAQAAGACVDGAPKVIGASQVGAVRVLGLELPVDQLATRAVTLVDTARIDPSALDLDRLVLPAGITLPLLRPLLQPLLDALPDIVVPATVAEVSIRPGEQVREADGRLVQRALHVRAAVLGQSLLDVVVGEASVGGAGVRCAADAPAPTAVDLALGCTTRRLTLIDVVPSGSRVRFLGAADRRLAGERVDIVFKGTGKVVARPVVHSDGSFTATAPLPSRRLRATNDARYLALIDDERSLNLKLERRMRVTRITTSPGRVVLAGRVSGPLAARAADRVITVGRRLSCRRFVVAGRGTPRRDGTFRIVVDAPAEAGAAVFRLSSRVRKTTTNPKLFPTYTLPRAVDLV